VLIKPRVDATFIRVTAALAAAGAAVLVGAAQAHRVTLTLDVVAAFALGAIAVFDLSERRIPHAITLPAIAFLIVSSAASGTLPVSLYGAIVLAGSLWALRFFGKVICGREALGFGDVTLGAVVGLALGPAGGLYVLACGGLACIVGALLRFRGRVPSDARLPVGAYVALAAITALAASSIRT